MHEHSFAPHRKDFTELAGKGSQWIPTRWHQASEPGGASSRAQGGDYGLASFSLAVILLDCSAGRPLADHKADLDQASCEEHSYFILRKGTFRFL